MTVQIGTMVGCTGSGNVPGDLLGGLFHIGAGYKVAEAPLSSPLLRLDDKTLHVPNKSLGPRLLVGIQPGKHLAHRVTHPNTAVGPFVRDKISTPQLQQPTLAPPVKRHPPNGRQYPLRVRFAQTPLRDILGDKPLRVFHQFVDRLPVFGKGVVVEQPRVPQLFGYLGGGNGLPGLAVFRLDVGVGIEPARESRAI